MRLPLTSARGSIPSVVAPLFVAVLCCGCGSDAGLDVQTAATRESCLAVSPTDIDLGVIAASGDAISVKVDVRNAGKSILSVDVQSSCGCATATNPEFSLSPGDVETVEVRLATRNRKGAFKSQIQLAATSPADPDGLERVTIPIHAVFVNEWRVQPQRVFLSTQKDGTLGGTFAVTAPTKAWDAVELGPVSAGVKLTETSVKATDLGVTRCYHIRVSSPDGNRLIVFHRKNQNWPFLTVPVLVGRS